MEKNEEIEEICNGRITAKVKAQRSVESSCIKNIKLEKLKGEGNLDS
jgi:hypothetical protein